MYYRTFLKLIFDLVAWNRDSTRNILQNVYNKQVFLQEGFDLNIKF